MYPLTFEDLSVYPPQDFVYPLWPKHEKMHMAVFLSTKHQIEWKDFGPDAEERMAAGVSTTQLLWEHDIHATTSVSKSFLLTTKSMGCNADTMSEEECKASSDQSENEEDPSYQQAVKWLDDVEHSLSSDSDNDGGILSTISAASGQGIESTSILLTVYEKISKQISSVMSSSKNAADSTKMKDPNNGMLERSTIQLAKQSPIWKALMNNSTLYVQVVVIRENYHTPGANINELSYMFQKADDRTGLLLGYVNLVKYDEPNHIMKPGRYLYQDLTYLFQHYVLQNQHLTPPWDMKDTSQYKMYEKAQEMKNYSIGYPYWKPEVAVKFLMDEDAYPHQLIYKSGMSVARPPKTPEARKQHPSGYATIPTLYVDEIGLTSEKYIPVNDTLTSLPLHITFDRSDVDVSKQDDSAHLNHRTATAGGISPARWRLLTHLSHSIESQKELGFEQSDIDDLRRLIADTNVTLLGITILASVLHLLFEFLTFKNEVSFWSNNTDLTGLSVRSLFLDMIGQIIIVLYLIEKDSSLLMIVPSSIGCLIAAWKCQRAAGLAFVKISNFSSNHASGDWWNAVPRLFGYELRAVRLEESDKKTSDSKDKKSSGDDKEQKNSENDSNRSEENLANLQAMSLECDRIATKRLGSVFLPLVLLYAVYSLVFEKHTGWYSWFITSASSAVYALGFVLMTPQLFLNYKLKSVAHLPWRVLVYKSLNTFIDDLFSFIIRMPTMARISCFRDDIVFFVYLYQRWLYPVDASRPVEGGGDGTENNITETKKNQ